MPFDILIALHGLKDTPVPTILVLGGIFLLVLAFVKAGIKFVIGPSQRKPAIIFGIVLLGLGIGLYLIPEPQTPLPPDDVYVDIIEDLQLSPISTSDDAHFIFKVGEIVTTTLKIQNTGITSVTIERFVVAVRGPDACDKGWGDNNYDFLGVGITLLPGQTYSYTQSRSFSKPGVYFAESTAKLPGRKWGGVPPLQRIYFFVIDPANGNLPVSACVTPVPKTP